MARFTLKKFFDTVKCEKDNKRLIASFAGCCAEEKPVFRAFLSGDLHTDGDPWRDRNNVIRRALTGISVYPKRFNVAVVAGDLTNSGEAEEYAILNMLMKRFYKTDARFIASMGNHDSQSVNWRPNFEQACRNYRAFCAEHGVQTEENYFSLSIDGQRLVCLGTEKMVNDRSWLSEAQLEFLKKELVNAANSKKPVIVINHQPLDGVNGINGKERPDAIVGEQNDELYTMLEKASIDGAYIIYASGHTHDPFSEKTIEVKNERMMFINLPSVLYNDGGGQCVILEIYDEKIKAYTENVIGGQKIENTAEIKIVETEE